MVQKSGLPQIFGFIIKALKLIQPPGSRISGYSAERELSLLPTSLTPDFLKWTKITCKEEFMRNFPGLLLSQKKHTLGKHELSLLSLIVCLA